jgi:hypothetical protein
MIRVLLPVCLLAIGISPALAKSSAKKKPNNATAQCTDGSYSTAKNEQGACSKHGGVRTWYGDSASTPKTAKTRTSAARPKNATAQCGDGSFSTAKSKQGACSKHGGVATWYADAAPAATPDVPDARPTRTKTEDAPRAPRPTTSTRTVNNPGAPQNATAKCKDGTLSFSRQHSGACSHHGGVAEWYR